MTGSIVTFDDAIPFMPIEKLVAQIEPQQDLHGYDAPWAAGGGVNKLDVSNTTHSAYNIGNIPNTLQPSTVYSFSIMGAASFNYRLYLGDSSDPVRGLVALNANYLGSGNSESFTTPASMEEYDRLVLAGSGSGAGNVDLSALKPEVSAGSTAPTAWTPYSNECPIAGWTGLSGSVAGKNLFNKNDVTTNAYINASGVITPATGSGDEIKCYSGLIPVKAGAITYSGTTNATAPTWNRRLHGYDANGNWVQQLGYYQPAGTSVVNFTISATVPSGVSYVRISGLTNDSNVQIELASAKTDYEEYQTILPITVSWQDEAGTVYGGTVDVVTGVLTVTDKFVSLTDAWSQAGNGSFYLDGKALDGKSEEIDKPTSAICNIYPSGINGGSTHVCTTNPKTLCTQNLNGLRFMFYDTSWGGVANFNAYVAQNPIQIVYKLAQPQTYQLTPQEVDTLVGQNNVFVDTGDVSVTYQSTSGSTPVRTSFKSPLKSYSYSALKLFGNTFIEHGKG